MGERVTGILSLRDELILMQDLAGQALTAYERAMASITDETEPVMAAVMRTNATSFLTGALNQVRDMALAAKRMEESSGGAVDVTVLQALISHTCEIVDEELVSAEHSIRMVGHNPVGIVENIATRLRTQLLDVDAIIGTNITPAKLDKEVREMIETVPEVA